MAPLVVKRSIAARGDVAQTRCNFPLVGSFCSPPAQLETVDLDNTYCDTEAMVSYNTSIHIFLFYVYEMRMVVMVIMRMII